MLVYPPTCMYHGCCSIMDAVLCVFVCVHDSVYRMVHIKCTYPQVTQPTHSRHTYSHPQHPSILLPRTLLSPLPLLSHTPPHPTPHPAPPHPTTPHHTRRYQCLCNPQSSYADGKPVTPYGRCTVNDMPSMKIMPGTERYYGREYTNNNEWQYRSRLRAAGVPWCQVEPESCSM